MSSFAICCDTFRSYVPGDDTNDCGLCNVLCTPIISDTMRKPVPSDYGWCRRLVVYGHGPSRSIYGCVLWLVVHHLGGLLTGKTDVYWAAVISSTRPAAIICGSSSLGRLYSQ
jgi:hypothetical protein